MMKTNRHKTPQASRTRRHTKPSLKWQQRRLSVRWAPEPSLVFANGKKTTDPKEGLAIYGPFGISTGEHPEAIRVGFVGSTETIEKAKSRLHQFQNFIAGKKDKRRQFPDFPGFNRDNAFSAEFLFNPAWESAISQRDLASLTTTRDKVQGFELAVDLFAKRVQLISEVHPTDIIICALPQQVEEFYSTIGRDEVRASPSTQFSPMARAIRKIIRQAEARGQTTFLRELFAEDASATPSLLSRNFRRALKASTNNAKCPVQITGSMA